MLRACAHISGNLNISSPKSAMHMPKWLICGDIMFCFDHAHQKHVDIEFCDHTATALERDCQCAHFVRLIVENEAKLRKRI